MIARHKRVKNSELDYYGTSWRCRENYDVEAAIRKCLNSLPFKVRIAWIRGHALRRKKEWHKLTWPETLNELADAEATKARDIEPTKLQHYWPEQLVSVKGADGNVTGKLPKAIRELCTAPGIMSFWQNKYKWTNRTTTCIDLVGIKSVTIQHSAAAMRRVR